MQKAERRSIARNRLLKVLQTHGIANSRTLEQKISDAGPSPLRVDPHILTEVRNNLVKNKELVILKQGGTTWYYRADTPINIVKTRLSVQLNVFQAFSKNSLTQRIGQTLEIATFRALTKLPEAEYYGRFTNLDEHGDETLYKKDEPPEYIGNRHISPGKKLDFLLRSPSVGWLGIECKNIREWLYPDRTELLETLSKCLDLDCIPVIIGRRIPYVTFYLLNICGVIIHQTYNQLLPTSALDVATKAKDKQLLGYHDIRIGNEPDARLTNFITKNLLLIAPQARPKYNNYRDLLKNFVSHSIPYTVFAWRVLQRSRGRSETVTPPPPFEESPNDWL